MKKELVRGCWYRCSRNGYEFNALVIDIFYCTSRALFQIEDWRGVTVEKHHFIDIAEWEMEHIV